MASIPSVPVLSHEPSRNGAVAPQLLGLSLTRQRRRTLGLIALIWFACGTLYLLPYILRGNDGFDLPAVLSHYSVSAVGLGFSFLLLGLTTRFRTMGKSVGFASSALAVLLLAGTLAAVDIALFDGIHAFFGREHGASVAYAVKWSGNFAIFVSQYSLIAVAFWTLETLEAHRLQQWELQEARTQAAQAQSLANRAKLSALRYQLNPHFLFNTLNSISSLVVTKRNADAELMLTSLSEFLRTTLAGDPNAPQTLEGELETIDAYLGLERIRFGDRLDLSIDCPPSLRDAQLPHFLLQPLVENAVKHGLAPSETKVSIAISARAQGTELVVAVENDCSVCNASEGGTGVGLHNVRDRLEAVYGHEGRLETIQREAGFIAIVRLPLEFPSE